MFILIVEVSQSLLYIVELILKGTDFNSKKRTKADSNRSS